MQLRSTDIRESLGNPQGRQSVIAILHPIGWLQLGTAPLHVLLGICQFEHRETFYSPLILPTSTFHGGDVELMVSSMNSLK